MNVTFIPASAGLPFSIAGLNPVHINLQRAPPPAILFFSALSKLFGAPGMHVRARLAATTLALAFFTTTL
ncbi:MAG TPA: hypothetical protein VHW70_09440, partial [Edaphobacter sp.]|nr:hypothetical protein [Edaphobacter sp.]